MRATASVAIGASPRSAILKNSRLKWLQQKATGDPVRRQFLVRGIAVALHDAAIVREQLLEMLAASARRVGIDDGRRIGSAPGPVIARNCPEVASLRLTAPGIEHRHWRLINGEFGGGQEIGL